MKDRMFSQHKNLTPPVHQTSEIGDDTTLSSLWLRDGDRAGCPPIASLI